MAFRLAAVALLLPLLVACGDKEPEVRGTPVEVVRALRERTVAAGTARVSMRFESKGTLTGAGVTALDGSRSDLKFAFAGQRNPLEIERRVVGDVLYLRLASGRLNRQWYTYDLRGAPSSPGGVAAGLPQFQHMTPTAGLEYLAGVADDVREDGTEKVRGTKTTRYVGTVDLAKARAAAADERVRRQLDVAMKDLERTSFEVTVWVDGEGRLRRLRHPAGSETTLTVELYDFGVRADVAPPPADQLEPPAIPTARTSPTG